MIFTNILEIAITGLISSSVYKLENSSSTSSTASVARCTLPSMSSSSAPLFKLTRKDSGYKGGPLPEEAKAAFNILRRQLISEPVMAFPKLDRQYALITDAATGTAETPGGLGAILTQVDKDSKFYAISFASRQLKDHEKNYSPFLLEAAAAVWGMDHFDEYLKGKKFILYTDHKPLEKLGHLHSKTMNRFQTALLEHDFVIQYKKGSDMPADYLSRLPASSDQPIVAAFAAMEKLDAHGRSVRIRTL